MTMRKFTEALKQTSTNLNESKSLKIESLDEFLSFGKEAFKASMGVMYKEEPVHQYLTEMWNNVKADSYRALESLNEATMDISEKRASVVQRFNSVVSQLTENTSDKLLQSKLVSLVKSYPEILNEVAIANAGILLERCDIRGTFKMHENSNSEKKKNLILAFYEPKSVKDMTDMLNTMKMVLHEAVINVDPGTYKVHVLPDGYGGFDTDIVPIINGQIKDAQNLESEILNAVSIANAVSEEERTYRNEAFKMFTAFMQDSDNRYNLSADKIQANIHDIDFFICLCLMELFKPVRKNIEHLQRNFFNIKFNQLNKLYDEYLIRAGLEPAKWEYPDSKDMLELEEASYAKLYELCDLVLNLSKYQRTYLRQIVLKLVTIIKPMIDSIRLDMQIYRDRTQLQY